MNQQPRIPNHSASRTQLRRCASLLLLVVVLMTVGAGVASAGPQGADPVVPVLIKFKLGAPPSEVASAIAASGGQSVRDLRQVRTRVINVPAGAADGVMAALAKHPSVERVQLAVKVKKAGVPDDAGYGQQWALPRIAWDQAYGTVDVAGSATIAVLDTGVDGSHPDLAGRIASGKSFLGTDPNTDPNGHGTALAGIAAASVNNGTGVAGVAYSGASISPVQVLGADGTGYDSDVAAGVLWAADNGAQVILMGFSSPDYSGALADAVDYAWSRGAVLVAATGNDGATAVTYPAGLPNVIGVAATDPDDAILSNSNIGSAGVAAPGSGIYTTLPGDQYGSVSGTSAASAHVAGLAALLVANGGDNTYIFNQVRGATDGVAGQSFGRINVFSALGAPANAPPAPASGPSPTPGPAPVYTAGAAAANVNFATTGLPAGASVSVGFSGTNNGGNPTSGTSAFTSPGPGANVGLLPGSSVSYWFPASVTSGGATYNAASPTGSIRVGAGGSTITVTGAYVAAKASTATSVVSSANPSVFGQSVTFTATVTSGAGTPTGTVTFKDGTATLAAGTLDGTGAATFSTDSLAVSTVSVTHSITASYGGDSNHLGSTSSPALVQVVDKANQTITVGTHAPATASYGSTFTVAATASSGLTVSYSSDGACGNIGALFTVTSPTGTCTVKYDETGNGNYNAAPQVTETVAAEKATATVILSGLSHTYDGTPKAATASTTPTGLSVTITYDGSSTAPTNAGDYAVVATVDDVNYQGSATGSLHVARADQTINFGALVDRTYGDAPFTVSATASSGLTVSFTASGKCSATGANGSDITITGAGSCTVTAKQGGDTNYNAAPDVPRTFSIAKAAATLTIAPASLGQTYDGTPRSVTVTTSPVGLSGVSVTYEGTAGTSYPRSTDAPTNAGSYAVVAKLDNPNYEASDAAGTLVVARASQAITVTTHAPTSAVFGSSFTVAATGGGSGNPVVYSSDGACSNAGATFTMTSGTGTCAVRYDQAGNDNYYAAPRVTESVNAQKAATSIVVSFSASPVQYSDRVDITATVSPVSVGGQTLTGSVQFSIGSTTIGSDTIDSSGAAHLTNYQVALAPGTYTVSAVFTPSTGSAPYFAGSTGTGSLVVTQEDARAYYSGALFVSTKSTTDGSFKATLAATVKDISAVDSSDTSSGNISKGTVKFVFGSGAVAADSPEACSASVGLVDAADATVGTATCEWSYNIGSGESASYTVGIVVGGYYSRFSSGDDEVVTVSKPLTSNFITGGGYLALTNSGGQKAGSAGTKNNFGFNVKYNKSGTSLQGNINTILRRMEGGVLHVYQVKGNSMTSLSTDRSTGKTTFNGKASIQDITDPLNVIPVDGNATLQVVITDKGEPGTNDTIGITVWNKSGGLWFSSNWTGTTTNEQALGGGNLVAR